MLIVLIDDVGFGASSAFGGPCNTPVAERLAANGLKLNRFHTTALCSPTRQAMLTGTQPPLRGHGRDHGDGHLGAGKQQHPAEGEGATRRDIAAQRVRDSDSSASVMRYQYGKSPPRAHSTSGPPDRVSSTSTGSSAARPTSTTPDYTKAPPRSSRPSRPRRATPSRRIWRPRHHLGAATEGADAGQTVLHVLRAWRHPRPTSCAHSVVGQVQGQVRRRVGCAAREDTQAAEEVGRRPQGRQIDQAPRRDPQLG